MKIDSPICIATVLLATIPAIAGAQFVIPPAGERQVKPVRGLSYTAREIEEVREAARTEKRFATVYKKWFELTAQWTAKTEAEIDALLPADLAIYADGGTGGDPKTNQPWPKWGAGICSLDKPFEVRSPHTGDIYGVAKEGEPFYDNGNGWVRESDGKRFYFRGIWNSYVIMAVLNSLDAMANTYMLTGDEAVARRTLYLLDKMASMRSKRGEIDGPVDWPYPRRVNEGFFSLMGNQANTRIYQISLILDMVGESNWARQESWSNPGVTVFENIRRHLIRVIEPESMKDLQNHGLSAYSAFLAKALLFGEPENVRKGIGATYGFLDNCVDRDGEYYEVSSSYGNLGYAYGGRLIRLLRNYDPAQYETPSAFPRREEIAGRLDFGNDPRWYALAVQSQFRMRVLGRELSYGDAPPDREIGRGWSTKELSRLRDYVLYFYELTANPAWKEELATIYWGLPGYLRERPSLQISSVGLWKEPEGKAPLKEASVTENAVTPKESILLGGKLTALLRAGEGKASRALFMRGGHSESHAHDDQLAISVYGRGMHLTGEFGYGFYGTPEHLGFGARPAAHQMVVIDEDLPASRSLWRSLPSADIEAFYPYAPAQVVAMSNPAQWSGAGVYRRQSWLIDGADTGNETFYILDLFQVEGGKRHDYFWNAPYLKPSRADGGLLLEGVTLQAKPKIWTLAAHWNAEYVKAEFNTPGKSWGERIVGRTGRIKDEPETDRKIGYWNPAPGNGYGFIYDIKAAETAEPWSAIWNLPDECSLMKWTVVPMDGIETVVSGKSGTLEIGTYHPVVAVRRKDEAGNLKSRFVSVCQVASSNEAWPVRAARPLENIKASDPARAIAIQVELDGGAKDLLLAGESTGASITAGPVTLEGEKGFLRYDAGGVLSAATLIQGTSLKADGLVLEMERPFLEAEVKLVKSAETPHRVEVSESLPIGGMLDGSTALFYGPEGRRYAHNEFFRLGEVKASENGRILSFAGTQGVILSTVEVERVLSPTQLQLRWPNMTGGREAMKSFAGHRLIVEGDAARSATITSLPERKMLHVDSTASFTAGDRLQILAIAPGDTLKIPATAQLLRIREGEWRGRINAGITITLSASAGEVYLLEADGKERGHFAGKDGSVTVKVDQALAPGGVFTLRRVSE